MGGVKYYIGEPTVGEYRLILKYYQTVGETDLITTVYWELLRLIPTIFGGKFTRYQIERAIEQGDLTLDGIKVSNLQMFKKECDKLIQSRQKYISKVITNNVPLNTYDEGENKGDKVTIKYLRKMVKEWYEVWIKKSQVLSYNDLNNMTIEDYLDFSESTEYKPKAKPVNKERINDLRSRLKRSKGGDD